MEQPVDLEFRLAMHCLSQRKFPNFFIISCQNEIFSTSNDGIMLFLKGISMVNLCMDEFYFHYFRAKAVINRTENLELGNSERKTK